ncbi:MAG: PHP domain-containing protein [Casimicrobiaceae bacterium]
MCECLIDLHTHSHYSDGVLPPARLVELASQAGITHLALTDHDELRGTSEAMEAARMAGLTLIPGVEISTEFADRSVHIVGLGIDPADTALASRLADIRSWREERAVRMAEALAAAGIVGALDGARHYAVNPDLVSRTHFAQYLVDAGYCANKAEVFARFMKPGKPGYVRERWLPVEEAVTLIRGAGGVAVLAHPARYEFDPRTLDALLDRFTGAGGEAIEVISGAHTPEDWARFGAIARRRGLFGSVGSDFHAPAEGRIGLGQLPRLSPSIPNILNRLGIRA